MVQLHNTETKGDIAMIQAGYGPVVREIAERVTAGNAVLESSSLGTTYADGFTEAVYHFEGGLVIHSYRDEFHVYDNAELDIRIEREQEA